jgi:hypothetical protein
MAIRESKTEEVLEEVAAVVEAAPVDKMAEERKTVVTAADGTKKYKCRYCGKWIKFDSWEEFEAGDYCHQLRDEKGYTEAALQAHRKAMSSDDVPVTEDGREYVKIAKVHRTCVREGIPVSRLVRAFGGDRTLDGPMHPKFQPVYVGKARYIHPDCDEKWGLDFMRNLGGRSNGATTEEAAVEAALS